MKMRFFDFEVTPNWWLCVLGDLPDNPDELTNDSKQNFTVIDSDMKNSRSKLVELLKEKDVCIVGYNIKGYDLIIANAIYQGLSPKQIKIINDLIIIPDCKWDTKEHIMLQGMAKRKLSGVVYQDLLDDGSGSLKEKEATLGLNILESSVDFNKEDLSDDDKKDMIYYCKQDVYASMVFYKKVVLPYTKVKLSMGIHFNIPEDICHKSTNARLVSIALKAERKSFGDEEQTEIKIPDKIKKYCYDNLPTNVLEKIRTSTEGFQEYLFHNLVSFGNGGVHSTYCYKPAENLSKSFCPCLYIESDSEYVLVNVDATSYYPSIMIQLNLLSRCVTDPKVFSDIFDERIALKHKKNKTSEDDLAQLADKLVLNTTFGASGNKWLDLYDPLMCTSVCRVGQILLASLACKLYTHINGLSVIQTNTDGILCYVPRKEIPKMEELAKEWTCASGIGMEFDFVSKIWQRDVNNYLLVKDDGKVKRKGGWLNDDYYRPGYVTTASANAFVCSKAAIDFLLKGKDCAKSIVENKYLPDFTIVCTKGPTYRGVIQRFNDGTERQLFKSNRVIATTDENCGKLYKYKMYKGNISYAQMPSIPEHCMLVNEDLSTYDFNDIKCKLDYVYYIQRTWDLLDIEWYQMIEKSIQRIYQFDINY